MVLEAFLSIAFGRSIDIQRGEANELTEAAKTMLIGSGTAVRSGNAILSMNYCELAKILSSPKH